MMRRSIILSLSVMFLLSLASLTFGAVTVKIKSGKEIRLYKDYHALVIGVSDYDYWPDLRGAVRDAKEVAHVLKEMGMSVTTLLNPTSAQLKTAMNKLTYGPGREQDRAILFFYSGHGETERLATGQKLGYIVPKDAPLPARDPSGFADKAVSMNQIETYALRIQSKHVLMVFDSCFSGTVFASLKSAPTDISEKSTRAVRQFITAGSDEEQVPDESVFKICFIQGIKGEADFNKDGYVTGSELGMHLDSSVVNYSMGSQHPQYGKIRNPELDKGDFIFVASGGTVVEEPSPLPTTTGTIRVSANVSGARIFIDGSDRGGVPATLTLDPKIYRVEVRKQGYDPWRTQVTMEAGRTASLMAYLTPEKPRQARLYVNPAPSDARIRILNIGLVYERGMELDPGSYHVEVSKDGYETDKRWVELASGEDKYESFRLEKSPERGDAPAFTNSIGMKFVRIPAGSFMMGSPSSEPKRDSNETQHRVTLSKPFYLQTTEVTQGQWQAVMGNNPSYFSSCGDNCPVEQVSWNDCQEFIRKLNQREGNGAYRLPTEAEWEYACRAGMTGPFNTGMDCLYTNQANYDGNYPLPGCSKGQYHRKTVPVGSFRPNAWGLYDIHGNVWEWCSDWIWDYPGGSVSDPKGPSSGNLRVRRGGNWDLGARFCRSAYRDGKEPDGRSYYGGFRVAWTK